MDAVADVSQALGDHMLRGWVLTDQSCPTPGCVIPLLRSPKGRAPIATFCVKCSGTNSTAPQVQLGAPSNASSESHTYSRSSTPPTEFSETPDSPIFVPVEETEETRRRRQQSDQASSEIGKKLLQGWAMLGDECPNDTCYGVPLVRPPKAGVEKDRRKECVICGRTYVTEIDWAGRETIVPFVSKTETQSTVAQSQGRKFSSLTSPDQTNLPFSSPFERHVEEQKTYNAPLVSSTSPAQPVINQNLPQKLHLPAISASGPMLSNVETLNETSRALQASLNVLSERLISINSSPRMDPMSLGATADAIHKVAQALGQVRNLQRDHKY